MNIHRKILIIATFFFTLQCINAQINVVHSIPSPVDLVLDITFDGSDLWVGGWEEDSLYKISILDGSIIESIPNTFDIEKPGGLTFDGTNLWIVETDLNLIHQIDIANENIINTINTPTQSQNYPAGLAWDGSNLWHLDTEYPLHDTVMIYKLDTDGVVLESFKLKGGSGGGLTWTGNNLWYSDNLLDKIYEIDISNHQIIDSLNVVGGNYPNGLTFDGQYLWLANGDSDSLYQIDIDFTISELNDLSILSSKLLVYPNPSSGKFTFESNLDSENLSISIFNLGGQMLLNKTFNKSSFVIDLDEFKSDVYFYTISNSNGIVKHGKLIKN